jgi:hypothetical protein
MRKSTKRVTRKMVNDALRARGRDESLREGSGLFLFWRGRSRELAFIVRDGEAYIDLTPDQWLKGFDDLLKGDKMIRKMKSSATKKSKK